MIGVLVVIVVLRGAAALHPVRPRPCYAIGFSKEAATLRRHPRRPRQVLAVRRHRRRLGPGRHLLDAALLQRPQRQRAPASSWPSSPPCCSAASRSSAARARSPASSPACCSSASINYALRLGGIRDVVLIIVTGAAARRQRGRAEPDRRRASRARAPCAPAALAESARSTASRSTPRPAPRARTIPPKERKNDEFPTYAPRPRPPRVTVAAVAARRRARGLRLRPAAGRRRRQRSGSGSGGDQSITFMPKQLNNPYTDVVLGGGKDGAEGDRLRLQVVGPLEASASSAGLLHQHADPGRAPTSSSSPPTTPTRSARR